MSARTDALYVCQVGTCPVCGGADRLVVAAGAYMCTSRRVVNAVAPGQNGNFGLAPIPIYGECGARYDEGMLEARRTQVRAQAQAAGEARLARDDEDARWQGEVTAALPSGDMFERLVLARQAGFQLPDESALIGQALSGWPDLTPLEAWFLNRAEAIVPPEKIVMERKTFLGNFREYRVAGWILRGASDREPRTDSVGTPPTWMTRQYGNIALTTDGQRLACLHSRPFAADPSARYNSRVYEIMADTLHLVALPPNPDRARSQFQWPSY